MIVIIEVPKDTAMSKVAISLDAKIDTAITLTEISVISSIHIPNPK